MAGRRRGLAGFVEAPTGAHGALCAAADQVRYLYQVAPAVSLPGLVAAAAAAQEQALAREESAARRRHPGLGARDRLGLFLMVCSALVGVQVFVPRL